MVAWFNLSWTIWHICMLTAPLTVWRFDAWVRWFFAAIFYSNFTLWACNTLILWCFLIWCFTLCSPYISTRGSYLQYLLIIFSQYICICDLWTMLFVFRSSLYPYLPPEEAGKYHRSEKRIEVSLVFPCICFKYWILSFMGLFEDILL